MFQLDDLMRWETDPLATVIDINKNGNKELSIQGGYRGSFTTGQGITFGSTFQMELKENDAIELYVAKGKIHSDYENYRLFTGKYLRPLIWNTLQWKVNDCCIRFRPV